MRVLFCTEGTYPFDGGGVSTWCDILCNALDDVEFVVFAVTGNLEVELKYQLPPNVSRLIHVPLWGMQEPAEAPLAGESFLTFLRRKRRTTPRAVEREFVPLLRVLLRAMHDDASVDEAARALHLMWRYFSKYDWTGTWRAQATWETFAEEALVPFEGGRSPHLASERPSVGDLTNALRWMTNFLTPLVAPIPDVDLVHSSIAGFAGIPGLVAKLERGVPFVVTEHGVYVRERYIAVSGGDFSPYSKRFLMQLTSIVARTQYAYADVVAPVANFNRRWETRLGTPESRIQTIYNGINPDLFVPGPKPPELQDVPVVVAAARVFPLKDIETMIRAAAVARERLPDIRFLVYGSLDADVPYVERCQELIEQLGLQGTFTLAGFHSSPAEVYNMGDISVLSSISEGFPYTVLESMSCARPVVATDVGGVREALEGFGIVVPPRDAEALGEAIVSLLTQHDLRAELGRRAREQVLARYRTSHSVGGYHRLYDELVNDLPKTTTPQEAL